MFNQNRCINTINILLQQSDDKDLLEIFPVSINDLIGNHTLSELLIDYLGDIYICIGLDNDYSENEHGQLISEAMGFLAECNNAN